MVVVVVCVGVCWGVLTSVVVVVFSGNKESNERMG